MKKPPIKAVFGDCGARDPAALYERQAVVAFLVQVVYLLFLFLQQVYKFFDG